MKSLSLQTKVCHENKSAVCRVVVRNFRWDGSRPTAYGVQALFANHFMLLWWQLMGSERWLKVFRVRLARWEARSWMRVNRRRGVVSKNRSHQNRGSFVLLGKWQRKPVYCLLGVRRIGGKNLSQALWGTWEAGVECQGKIPSETRGGRKYRCLRLWRTAP